MPKTLVVFHQIGPYHHARLNAAACHQQICALEWSGKANFEWGSGSAESRYEKFTAYSHAHFGSHRSAELRKVFSDLVRKVNPDIVAVNGWFDFGSTAVIQACHDLGLPMVLMSESTQYDFSRNRLKEFVKSRIASLFAAALVGGTAHRHYLERLGFDRSRIFYGYDTVDNDYFARVTNILPNLPSGFIPGKYFLASARFVPKKNLERLIVGFAKFCEGAMDPQWRLVLLGDGPLRNQLETLVRELGLCDQIHMPGFLTYPQLPSFYQSAFAFIHASTTEQWGLVVNEAMASGLPVIVSRRCGCAQDLVIEGRNGFTFDPICVEGLTECLHRLVQDSGIRTAYAEASREIINLWSPARFGSGLRDAVATALTGGPKLKSRRFIDASILRWMNRK